VIIVRRARRSVGSVRSRKSSSLLARHSPLLRLAPGATLRLSGPTRIRGWMGAPTRRDQGPMANVLPPVSGSSKIVQAATELGALPRRRARSATQDAMMLLAEIEGAREALDPAFAQTLQAVTTLDQAARRRTVRPRPWTLSSETTARHPDDELRGEEVDTPAAYRF